jgi:hypothetical protein
MGNLCSHILITPHFTPKILSWPHTDLADMTFSRNLSPPPVLDKGYIFLEAFV